MTAAVPARYQHVLLYTYSQAAAILGVEVTWLQRHIKRLPHVKLGRRVSFTPDDLRRIVEIHHYEPPQPSPPVAPAPHPLADLKPLPSRRRR